LLNKQEWIAQLPARLFVGYFFIETGWGKPHHLDGFALRFAGWGIPYPYFSAAFSAYTELVGGMLTLFGIGTPLVAIPMITNMLVAVIKVNLRRVTSLDDFVELKEPLNELPYLWLLLSGAGRLSVDYLANRVVGRKGGRRRLPPLAPAECGATSVLLTCLLASAVGVVPSRQLRS